MYDDDFLARQRARIDRRIAYSEQLIAQDVPQARFKAEVILTKLYAARAQLNAGRYGMCVDCDAPIGRTRLETVPAAIRCVECQRAFERQHTPASKYRPSG